VIVANMARSPSDQKWRALDGEALLASHRLAAGYLYQAQLRVELTRNLGVSWRQPAKGMAEIEGVPRGVLDEFSQRRHQVLARLAETGGGGWRAAQVAAVDTRDAKEHVELERLRETWAARAAEHGFGDVERNAALDRVEWSPQSDTERRELAATLVGPQGLTERQTTFSGPDAVKAWAEAQRAGADAAAVRERVSAFLDLAGVVEVAPGAPGRPARYSTRDLLRVEHDAVTLVRAARNAGAPAVADVPTEPRTDVDLAPDQVAMIQAVTTSPDGIVCVVGRAGAGKTTAIRAAARLFIDAGVPVLGAAPSGHAAEKLADETGIAAVTLHRLLADAARDGLPRGCVVFIDEAGMAETRVLAPVLALTARVGGKAVLVGDPGQLPAVGAGGLFPAIVDELGATQLTANRRQQNETERRALAAVRAGWGRDYVDWADGAGRIVRADDPIGARARLISDWWRWARDDRVGNVMIAFERRDVSQLNAVGRTLMRTEGLLAGPDLVVEGSSFACGDRIVCLRNSDYLGVRNGTPRNRRRDRRAGTLDHRSNRPRHRRDARCSVPRGRPRPPRLRHHRARRPGRDGRASLRAGSRPRTPAGVGLRGSQPCS
jgi:hypothetical protein